MDRLRIAIFAAVLMGLICLPTASAQTAANIAIISGNGQLACISCVPPRPNLSSGPLLQPLVVRVTDAAGKPIANKEVDWTLNSSGAIFGNIRSTATFTDSTGTATNRLDESAILTAPFATGFAQATITATSDSAVATFFETQSLSDSNNRTRFLVEGQLISPLSAPETPIKGVAGGTSSTTLVVHLDDSLGNSVPNIAVRVLQEDSTDTGSVSCATGPGADPGSILTDSTGNATCTLVFGAKPGTGTFHLTVGGTASNFFDSTGFPPVFLEFFAIAFNTTAAIPGGIQVSSGSGQSAAPGVTLPLPLVARVTDAGGVNSIAGSAVVWTVSPAGAATVNPATSTSDAQGLVTTNVTLSSSAAGQVVVTAALTGANSASKATFNVNAVISVTVASLQKLTGDSQTAIVGASFSQPLVVQVNTSAGGSTNIPVTFSVSGPGTIGGLTSSTVNTDSSGKAQVTVTAGSTAGAVTVTATAGAFSQSFTLTVAPVGPSVTAGSFANAAGGKQGSLSPCSLATISASGLAPGVQGTLNPANVFGPLPLSLGPDKVTINNIPAPILRISNSGGQEQVTVQVPCEVSPGSSVPVIVSVAGGSATANVAIQPASPGIFETLMSDGVSRAVMVRPDGSFVSLENPARRGEIIRVYVTGLGPTAPAVGTNSIAIPGTDSMVLGLLIVGVNNSGARVVSARVAPTQIGVYEVAFQVDSNAPTGNNIVLSVAVNPADGSPTQFSNGSKIPIQ